MISVVIPVRNEEENLKKLLPLIRELNNPKDYELIIVDGQSSDKSVEIAKKYGARVFIQNKKLGVANAKNIGWKKAKSEIILFLEADHRIKDKNVFKLLGEKFRKQNLDAATVFIWPIRPNFLSKIISIESDITHYSKNVKACWTLSMFKRSVLENVGGYDENLGYGEDQELAKRVRKKFERVGVIKDSKIYFEQITSLKRLFKQGVWYGRNFIDYFRKTKDFLKLFWIMDNVLFLPFLFLSLITQNLLLILTSIFLLVPIILYTIRAFIITKNPYSFFVFLIKTVRSYGEMVGMLSRLFVKHKGK